MTKSTRCRVPRRFIHQDSLSAVLSWQTAQLMLTLVQSRDHCVEESGVHPWLTSSVEVGPCHAFLTCCLPSAEQLCCCLPGNSNASCGWQSSRASLLCQSRCTRRPMRSTERGQLALDRCRSIASNESLMTAPGARRFHTVNLLCSSLESFLYWAVADCFSLVAQRAPTQAKGTQNSLWLLYL